MKLIYGRFSKIIACRQIIRSMVVKNLKDKYIGSALGISWAIINPILVTLAVTFVFTQVIKSGIRNFPLLVLSGLLPWFFFVNSISESTNSIKQNIDILNRFVMPKEIIPISVVLANFINFLLGFIIMLPVFIVFNPGTIKYIFLLPLIMLLHFAFTLGIAMLFSIINVYFRDLSQLVNVGMMFLFWLTPVFYTLETIPVRYRPFIIANPVTSYIAVYQTLLYQGGWGSLHMWLLSSALSLLSCVAGYAIFLKKEGEILKYI